MHTEGAHTNSVLHFYCTWIELEAGKHINWLKLRVAQYALLQLASPGDIVQLHLDNMTAITFIRKKGGTRSLSLCMESHPLPRIVSVSNGSILLPSLNLLLKSQVVIPGSSQGWV